MRACGMSQRSQVTKISFVASRSQEVTSARDESTSSVYVSSDETSIIRPRYAGSTADDEHHVEQISIIPAAAAARHSASTISGDGIGRGADELPSRTRLRPFTSKSFMSEDGTKYVHQVSFKIGVEDPHITANVTGQSASVPQLTFVESTGQQSRPSVDGKARTGDNQLSKAARGTEVNNAPGPESAVAEDALVVPVARAQRGQLDKEQCLPIFGDYVDTVQPERHSSTSSLSSESEENSQLGEEQDVGLCSKVSSDEDKFDLHLDESTFQEVEAPLVQQETRSTKHQTRHQDVSDALRSMGVVTSEKFSPHNDGGPVYVAGVDGEQPNEGKCSGVYGENVNEIPRRRHSRTSSQSSSSPENSQLEEEEQQEQEEQVGKSQASRLFSKPLADKETFDSVPKQNVSHKVDESDLMQRETRSSRNKSRHEGVSDALKAFAFPASEEFSSHDNGEQLDAEKRLRISTNDVNKMSRGPHSRTSSLSSSSEDSSPLEEQDEEEFRSGSKPSKETVDSQSISGNADLMIVNEPALVQQETRNTKTQTRHKQLSSALKSIEVNAPDKFNPRDRVAHADGEQLDVNEITRRRHDRTLSSSSDSESSSHEKAEEKEVGKTEALRLRSKPSSDSQTSDSHPKKSIVQNVEPALLQHGTRSTIQQIGNEDESRASRSMEEFTPRDHEVNIAHAEIPPEKRPRTSSSSSNSENNLQVKAKEKGKKDNEEIGKIQALQLYSESPTDRETFDSHHPELNTSQKVEHSLVQRETRNTKHQTKLEQVSNALRSMERLTSPELTSLDHGDQGHVARVDGEQLDKEKCLPIFIENVHQISPGRHSTTTSCSTSSSSEDDFELEEEEKVRRVADDEDANEHDEAVEEEAVVKSDPVTKQRRPAVNASLGVLQSRQLSDADVTKNSENYPSSSANDSFTGASATQCKSTEESPHVDSSRPGNRLFSFPTVKRPYFYTEQSSSDQRPEPLNAEANGNTRYDMAIESEASRNVEASSRNTCRPENQYRPLFVGKDNNQNIGVEQSSPVYGAAKPIVTRAGETRSWKSSESSTGSEALSEKHSYSGGLSTQVNTSSGLEQKAGEDIRQLDFEPHPTLYRSVSAAAETVRADDATIPHSTTSVTASDVQEDEVSVSRQNDNYQSKPTDEPGLTGTGLAAATVSVTRNESDVIETTAEAGGECDDAMMRPDKQQSPSSEPSSRETSDRSEQQKRRSLKLRWLRDASADENETLSKVAGDIWQRAGGRSASLSNRQRPGELSVVQPCSVQI